MRTNAHRLRIRRHRPSELVTLLVLWERSVRASHNFLTEADIVFYRPLVAQYLATVGLELYVLADLRDRPIGFMALAGQAIDALFLEPVHRRRGFGRRLIAYAQSLRGGALTVEVNTQNVAARGFYEALGFVVVSSSPIDDTGRPHGVLRMRQNAAIAREETHASHDAARRAAHR